MNRTSLAVLCGMTLMTAAGALAQTPAAHETDARVPELDKFHVTIYKLWHTAWPKKDLVMLKALQPDVQKGAQAVAGAKLPGILRDKEGAWKAGVAKLQEYVSAYAGFAGTSDSAGLIGITEKVHAQYEVLVRLVRPVLKEVGDFHEVLYVLYHYHVPSFALDSITVSAKILQERMTALDGATLPARRQAKQETFAAARASLSKTVTEFAAAVETKDRVKITKAMDVMHDAYQALEHVFD